MSRLESFTTSLFYFLIGGTAGALLSAIVDSIHTSVTSQSWNKSLIGACGLLGAIIAWALKYLVDDLRTQIAAKVDTSTFEEHVRGEKDFKDLILQRFSAFDQKLDMLLDFKKQGDVVNMAVAAIKKEQDKDGK